MKRATRVSAGTTYSGDGEMIVGGDYCVGYLDELSGAARGGGGARPPPRNWVHKKKFLAAPLS